MGMHWIQLLVFIPFDRVRVYFVLGEVREGIRSNFSHLSLSVVLPFRCPIVSLVTNYGRIVKMEISFPFVICYPIVIGFHYRYFSDAILHQIVLKNNNLNIQKCN